MSRLGRWLRPSARRDERGEESERIVPRSSPTPRAELVVAGLLLLAALFAVGFVVVYLFEPFPAQHQLLGITLGLSLAGIAAALILVGQRVIVTEELEEDYPEPEHPDEVEEVAEIVEQSGGGVTRKRLLTGAGVTAGGTLGVAALAPALSMGPWFDVEPLYETPWVPGRRLVDKEGKPFRAEEIEEGTFYTAFPEGADRRSIGAPLVVVRIPPATLRLPPGREGWAPQGILAFSKICPHAGCAVALYRHPKFAPAQPEPALVCPCHYSTFDPTTGGKLLFGPAGRALPQLPLEVDRVGEVRAGGQFSGPIGPGWWGVRMRGGDS